MRYFFSLARSEPALSVSIDVLATAGRPVALGRLALRLSARLPGTTFCAVDMTTIALPTENHLAVATYTVEESSTGLHQRRGPMRAGF
jgi:hypothetical protein